MRWVDKYKSTNNITRKKRDYTSYKITNSHILFIKKQLKQNKTITMDELLTKLKTKYPYLILSRVYLGRVVRDINITLKQTRLRHVPKTRYKKPIVIKNQIKEFYLFVVLIKLVHNLLLYTFEHLKRPFCNIKLIKIFITVFNYIWIFFCHSNLFQ